MVDVEHPVSICLHRNIRRAIVEPFRSWRSEGDARFRNKAQQRLRVGAEATLRNDVPYPLSSWAARAAGWDRATRRFKGRVRGPGDRDENGYRGAGAGVDQAAEVTSNFRRRRDGDRTLPLSPAEFIQAKEPESFVSTVIKFGQNHWSTERKSPIILDIGIGLVQHPTVVWVYVQKGAWGGKIFVISVKEKSVAVKRVAAGFRVVLLDALPQTVLGGKRTRQYVYVFDRVVRWLIPSCKARGL